LNEVDPDEEYTPNVPADEVYETGMFEYEFAVYEDEQELINDECEDEEDNVDRL
jgi:hypothetical protein